MLSAPRRGEAIPNPSGKIAIYSKSIYDFNTHKRTSTWETIDLATGKTALVTSGSGVGEVVWLDDSRILYTNGTQLWISNVENFTTALYAPLPEFRLHAIFSNFSSK